MSRLGKLPIEIPAGVKAVYNQGLLQVEGPKGKLSFAPPKGIDIQLESSTLTTHRRSDEAQSRAFHGMTWSIVRNMVQGVSTGFEKKLIINGTGYRAAAQGQSLNLTLGLSHPVNFQLPQGVTAKVEGNTTVVLTSADKALLGDTCAKIRALRPPEPYKGKGIRYSDEVIRRKAGKAAAGGK